MINSEKLKSEIDKIPSEYYSMLYKLLKSLGSQKRFRRRVKKNKSNSPPLENTWKIFINETYGSLADDPIKRYEQGSLETRTELL